MCVSDVCVCGVCGMCVWCVWDVCGDVCVCACVVCLCVVRVWYVFPRGFGGGKRSIRIVTERGDFHRMR